MLLCLACGAEWDESFEACPTDGTRLVPRLEEQTQLGPYTLIASLGGGGMARVYKALAPDGQEVALKVLFQQGKADAITRFDREGRILAAMAHPHVVQILDAGESEEGSRYLAMELLHGEDLSARLKRAGPMSLDEVLALASQILDALDAIHAAGIVHRDLKPSNIWLCEGPAVNAKLIDFGIARALDVTSRLTQAGKIIGTPAYLAPEQLRGDDQLDSRADIFSFGVTLYEALTGRLPIEAPDAISLMVRVASEDPTPPEVYRPDLPRPFSVALLRSLEKEPSKRFPTAGEFALALQEASQPRERRPSAELPAFPQEREAGWREGSRHVTVVVVERASAQAPSGFVGNAIETLRAAGGMAEPLGGGRVAALFGADGNSVFGEQAAAAVLSLRHPALRIGASTDPLSAAAGYDLDGVGASRLLAAAAPGELRVDEPTYQQIAPFVSAQVLPDGSYLIEPQAPEAKPRAVLGVITRTLGRETELTRLRAAVMGTARAKRGRGILILGEDGVGKSRLMAEAHTLLTELVPDALIFRARGELPRQGEPYGLFAQLLAAAGAPPILPLAPPPGIDPGQRRSRATIQDALHAWLANLSGARMVCVLLEDLHLADPESLAVLGRLLGSAAGPLLLLASARPELVEDPRGAELARAVSRLDLLPLEVGNLVALLSSILRAPAPEALVTKVAEVSGGNPLLIEEYLRSLVDLGILRPGPSSWALAEGLHEAPRSFEEMLGSRFASLPEEAQALLLRAAAFGDEFPVEVLPALGVLQAQPLLSLLEEREFLVRDEARPGWCHFWHPAERQLWYDSLPAEDRTALHRGIGRWLREQGVQELALLAWHAHQGERHQKAARYHRDLAALSYARGAEDAALAHLNRSISTADFAPEQFDLVAEREELLYQLGRTEESWQDLRLLEDLAAELGDPHRRARVTLKQARLLYTQEPEQVRAALEEAVPILTAAQDEIGLATCYQLLGRAWLRLGELEQSLKAAKKALRMAQDIGRRGLELDAVELLTELSTRLGDLSRALKAAERGLALVRRSGDQARELHLRASMAGLACEIGRYEEGEAHAREAISLAQELRLDATPSQIALGRAQLGQGRIDEAIQQLDDALLAAASSPALPGIELCMAEALFVRGAPGDGARGASYASAVIARQPDTPTEALCRALIARWRLKRRDLDGALQELQRAEEIRAQLGGLAEGEARVAFVWYLALLAAGRPEEAARALADAAQLLHARAERISDDEVRLSYLSQVTDHREILDAAAPSP